jgi:hypothetical protein
MKKELTEQLTNFICYNNTNLTPEFGGWHKNVIRGVRADGTDVESKPLNKANSAFTGVAGTKSMHDSNRAFLKMTKKIDQIGKRGRKFRKVLNGMGKEVRQGYPQIVKGGEIK